MGMLWPTSCLFFRMFFERKYNFSPDAANFINGIIYIISAVFAPLLGLVIDKTGRNLFWVFLSILGTLVSHMVLAFSFINPYIAMVRTFNLNLWLINKYLKSVSLLIIWIIFCFCFSLQWACLIQCWQVHYGHLLLWLSLNIKWEQHMACKCFIICLGLDILLNYYIMILFNSKWWDEAKIYWKRAQILLDFNLLILELKSNFLNLTLTIIIILLHIYLISSNLIM